MTEIGDLNRRLVLEAPSDVPDGAGGVTRSYATATIVWAQLSPIAAHSELAADALGVAVTHKIVIRAGRSVSAPHRFRDGARIFQVVSWRESADRRFTEIAAQEREN